MKTKLEEIKTKLNEINLSNGINDGRDSANVGQNCAYGRTSWKISELNKELARVAVDGLTDDELNQMWKKSYEGLETHLPEHIYTHCVRYIAAIEAVKKNM